jgi:hypothetical protein
MVLDQPGTQVRWHATWWGQLPTGGGLFTRLAAGCLPAWRRLDKPPQVNVSDWFAWRSFAKIFPLMASS